MSFIECKTYLIACAMENNCFSLKNIFCCVLTFWINDMFNCEVVSLTQCSHALTWCINAIERKQIFKKKMSEAHLQKAFIIV